MGSALFEASQNSSHDDGMIIAEAPSVIRKQLFNNDEIITGDPPRERQMASVPQVLHHLIQFLLEGGTFNENNYSIFFFLNIANNIFQLTLLNIKGEIQLLT